MKNKQSIVFLTNVITLLVSLTFLSCGSDEGNNTSESDGNVNANKTQNILVDQESGVDASGIVR